MRPRANRLSLPGLRRCAILLVVALSAAVASGASAIQQPRPLRVIHNGAATSVVVRDLNGMEMVRLVEVASALGGSLRPGDHERQAVLRLGETIIRFEAGRSFVQVGGNTRVLPGPTVRQGGDWFVPLEFVSRVLPDVLPGPSRYETAERTLAVGEGYPVLEVEIGQMPGATRVTLNTDPPAPMEIREGERGVSVLLRVGFLASSFLGEAPGDGVVERVDLYRGDDGYVLEITTGRNYSRIRQERGRGRLSLDLIRAGVRAESGAEVLPSGVETGGGRDRPRRGDELGDRSRPAERVEVRTVAIDAGHGGSDRGATSRGGIAEKDVALAVARALADRLEIDYGLQVILTRDSDRRVELDDRAVAANAAHADLFISIHLNASPSSAASGSLVYFHSAQSVARPSADSAVHFVPWDNAQARFLSRSRALAEALAEELEALPIPSRGVADAPIRVLSGTAMPAVQVELGFVTSSRDREELLEPGFPERAARALAAGILRYRTAAGTVRQTRTLR